MKWAQAGAADKTYSAVTAADNTRNMVGSLLSMNMMNCPCQVWLVKGNNKIRLFAEMRLWVRKCVGDRVAPFARGEGLQGRKLDAVGQKTNAAIDKCKIYAARMIAAKRIVFRVE